MFTSRYLNNVLKSVHERVLRLIYIDYELSFGIILEENKQKSIHLKNLESLTIKIYEFQASLLPPILSHLFVIRENKYNLKLNIKQILKKLKNAIAMPPHVECAKRTFEVLALLSKNCNTPCLSTPVGTT